MGSIKLEKGAKLYIGRGFRIRKMGLIILVKKMGKMNQRCQLEGFHINTVKKKCFIMVEINDQKREEIEIFK